MPISILNSKPHSEKLPDLLDYAHSREYYGVVRKGKIVEYEPGNPIIYSLDEIDELKKDYPRAKIVKIRLTAMVISEVII